MLYMLLGTAAGSVVAASVFLVVNFGRLPVSLPWLYSLPWGEAMLVNRYFFLSGLVALLMVIAINFLIAKKIERIDRVVAMVIAGASWLLTAIYLASFFRVLAIMLS